MPEPRAAAYCLARDPVSRFPAMSAFALGLVQLAAPKGTLPHRTLGGYEAGIALFTLVMLPLGVWRAHHHQVQRHRWAMISIFVGALVVAGLFTLAPGHIIHAVIFGH